MPFLIVAAGIAALLMATSAAHAYDEMSTSCGQAIVHLIINNDKEFGTVYHNFGVRWRKEPRKTVIQYDHETHALTVNGKRCSKWVLPKEQKELENERR